jgi:hypothetical protein
MTAPVPGPPSPRASVVMDYQNVHLTGHELFGAPKHFDKHETLIDPLLYAQQLLRVRNAKQRPGYPPAVLGRVLVYRGQPSDEHDPGPYAYTQAAKAQWERDPRVKVTYRPLKYYYEYGADNRPLVDISGKKRYSHKQEKGIDVLVAMAVLREARMPDTGLVILASTDTDLAPVLDEACALHLAKIETVSWWSPDHRNQQLRADRVQVWNTRLNEDDFVRARDLTDYWK